MNHNVCADRDLPEGTMRGIDLGGKTILIAHINGACYAVAGKCPHAGGPLADGILSDGVVTCPWHKAAFRVETGARMEPPAVDALERYPARFVDGRVMVSDEPEQPAPAHAANGDAGCIAILGSGAAGAVAAQTLRENGFTGRVVLIGQEDRLPYDRTVLSKYALSGEKGGEKTPLHDAAFYTQNRIERRTATVTALDPTARILTFADSDQLAYDAALAATGALPRKLEVPGHDLPGVHLLRTPADVDAILATAAQARHAVVVGAGYIGLEAAGSLRERGLEVTVVAPQPVPLQSKLGPEVGAVFRRVHERKGVVFHLGQEVARIEGEGRAQRVVLKDGTVLPAELVLAGLGVTPATSMLQSLPLRKDHGIDVDAQLRAAEGLYAAGDIAAYPLYGKGDRIRVEHWRVAQQHGRVAALNMLGKPVTYDAVPYFWTIHYRQRLDYVGHAESWDDVVIDGDLEKPEFLAFYVQDGQVRAVAGWGRDRQMAATIRLLQDRQDWTVEALRHALP